MEHKRASVEIRFEDIDGQPYEPPFNLGAFYRVRGLVTNLTTTRGGHPYEAELEIGFGISIGGIDIIPYAIGQPRLFPPEGMVDLDKKFYISEEFAGLSGKVVANVFEPFNGVLASAEKRFEISHELGPEAIYQVQVHNKGLAEAGIILPFLSPDLDMSEGQVGLGVMGSKTPPPPPAPAPKVVDYTKGKPASGLDTTSEPEPPAEWQGEVYTSNRIG